MSFIDNELPQFFNVLSVNMSVVGPRPHMIYHTEKFRNKVDGYMTRHFVKPGITGLPGGIKYSIGTRLRLMAGED